MENVRSFRSLRGGRCCTPLRREPAAFTSLLKLERLTANEFSREFFQVWSRHSWRLRANEGLHLRLGVSKTNPSSAGEQLGPPHTETRVVSTRRDVKADADSNREPVGCNHAELFSKHDLVMLRGFAPRTPKSTPGKEAGKTLYGVN
jgi:hypothetical protein